MKALSIRQPWAWLILHAGKDIENRNWHTNFRGRILVHAANAMHNDDYDSAYRTAAQIVGPQGMRAMPEFRRFDHAGIVGSVEIADCVTYSNSPWFCGKYGFVLRNPKILPFTPVRGALGLFNVVWEQAN